ncbi:unnamed protein product [Periconia digitata]|uniref:F-box domain-containing protein n=1 Tax=Periconia digitata TaxID=1303443 RepID=A0A9W4UB45_9PLEO|nr:unnamed protein product [Periconia digitata]
MQLLDLPTEILGDIFHHVGSPHFFSDASRLLVCKQWFQLARLECSQNLYISLKSLRRLVSFPDVDSIQGNLQTLDLSLSGFEHWLDVELDENGCRVRSIKGINLSERSLFETDDKILQCHGQDRVDLKTWTDELNDTLLRLATIVRNSRSVCTLRIYATRRWGWSRSQISSLTPHLSAATLSTFLSTSKLTTLDLDTAHIDFKMGDCHLCLFVARHLNTLRHLRLRIQRLCVDALTPASRTGKLELETMLVNISHRPYSKSSNALWEKLIQQGQLLAEQMASPKMARILRKAPPHFRGIQAYDVLARESMSLGFGDAWDAEGKPFDTAAIIRNWRGVKRMPLSTAHSGT